MKANKAGRKKRQRHKTALQEFVKKHETAETEAELMARLASVDDDEDEGAPTGVEKKKEERHTTDSGLGSSIDSIAEETVNKRMMYKFGILHLHPPPLKLNSDSEKRWKDIPTMFHF